eukprot:13996391-Alexandrium_andersonii.AAC.1
MSLAHATLLKHWHLLLDACCLQVHMHSLLCVCSSIVPRHCYGVPRTVHCYRVLANVQRSPSACAQ